MVDKIRHSAAWVRSRVARAVPLVALLAAVAVLTSCNSVVYHPGPPPPDAQLRLSEVEIVRQWDTVKLTGRVSWTASWSIDSVEFCQRRYRLGVAFGRKSSSWTPPSASTAITQREGARSDTLRCDSFPCPWMSPKVMVMAQIDPGHFLSVAESTIVDTVGLFP